MSRFKDDPLVTPRQHMKPCGDCPWRRAAIPSWLGSNTIEEWLFFAHGEARIDCHKILPHQCAGAATYRNNVCKSPRDPALLLLPADHVKVFSSPREFREHHGADRVWPTQYQQSTKRRSPR